MARTSKKRELNVWMNGELVGVWNVTASGKHEFRYAEGWKESENARPLSLSMILQPSDMPHSGDVVEYYFDNLLPDNKTIRNRIQSRFGTKTASTFDLLNEIGRDCVGAIQLLSPDSKPGDIRKIEGKVMKNSQIEKRLRTTVTEPALGIKDDEELRISIAGAQEKTGLLFDGGRWYTPLKATPSTHIFKLPLGKVTNIEIDLSTSVENEWLCLKILEEYKLKTVRADIREFGDQKALVVERFDRKLSDNSKWLMRLPMEDMCQVYGLSSGRKYENDGGPGVEKIMKFLLGSMNAKEDRRTFFKAQIIYWMLCATDGHAKNYSIFIEKGGRYRLTPLYDVISAHPVLGKGANQLAPQKAKMAMAVLGKNRHYAWRTIYRRHWLSTAKKCGFNKDIDDLLNEIIEQTPEVIKKVLKKVPKSFPVHIAKSIFKGLDDAKKILEP